MPGPLRDGDRRGGGGRRARRGRCCLLMARTALLSCAGDTDLQLLSRSSTLVVHGSRRGSPREVSAQCARDASVVPIRTVHPWRTCGFVDRHGQRRCIPPRVGRRWRARSPGSSPLDHRVKHPASFALRSKAVRGLGSRRLSISDSTRPLCLPRRGRCAIATIGRWSVSTARVENCLQLWMAWRNSRQTEKRVRRATMHGWWLLVGPVCARAVGPGGRRAHAFEISCAIARECESPRLRGLMLLAARSDRSATELGDSAFHVERREAEDCSGSGLQTALAYPRESPQKPEFCALEPICCVPRGTSPGESPYRSFARNSPSDPFRRTSAFR